MAENVAIYRVSTPTRQAVRDTVLKAIDAVDGFSGLPESGRILVKVNCVSAFLTPGANTSPWMLDAVLHALRSRRPQLRFIVADSDSSARTHVEAGFRLWGYDRICEEHGVELVNLARHGWTAVDLGVPSVPRAEVSTLALGCDAVVAVPVLKTHTWSGGSCAMKSLYGLFGPNRHNYHLWLDEVIVALQKIYPVALCVVDGLVGMEAGGPVMGRPRELGVVAAGREAAAVDAAVFDLVGMRVGHVELAARRSVLQQVGDDPGTIQPFVPAKQNLNSRMHYFLRHLPGGRLLFETFLFHPLRWASTAYQIFWYYWHGRRSRRLFYKQSPWAAMFGPPGDIYLRPRR